jgi:hypothetical protein
VGKPTISAKRILLTLYGMSTMKESVLKSNELERMVQRAAFRGTSRYYLASGHKIVPNAQLKFLLVVC